MKHRSRGRHYPNMHDINVTNLVDVVLVLLIIFMITAPLLQSGIEVNLPKTTMADAQLSEGVVVTVDQKGVVYIDDRIVNLDQFEGTLKTAYDKSEIKKVFIRADEAVSHGRVVEVMGHIKGAGIIEVGLVTREPEIPARLRQGRR